MSLVKMETNHEHVPSPNRHRDGEKVSFVYDLFISYRRKDGATYANWLRRRLTTYRLPRALKQPDAHIRVFQDIAYERATEDFWRNSIEPAVRNSRYLCVVATHGAMEERHDGALNWVEREISTFLLTRQKNNIFVVRGASGSDLSLPANLLTLYPHIEQLDVSSLRSPWRHLRNRSQLDHALLTIVAPLLDIAPSDMPILREEEKRRRRESVVIGTAVLSVVLVVLALLGLAWSGERARAESRALAARSSEMLRRDQPEALDLAFRAWARAKTKEANAAAAFAFPQLVASTSEHSGSITHAVFSPDNRRILTLTDDGKVWLWDIFRGKLMARIEELKYGQITQAEFLSNPERILTIDKQCEVRVWDAFDGHILETDTRKTIYPTDRTVAVFSSGGERMVRSENDSSVHLWNRETDEDLVLPGRGELVHAEFSQDGKRLLTENESGVSLPTRTARIWDTSNGRLLGTFEQEWKPTLSPDGQRIVSLHLGDHSEITARVWSAATGRWAPIVGQSWSGWPDYDAHVPGGEIFSLDGKRILSSVGDNETRVWDASSGQLLANLNGAGGALTTTLFSPDAGYAVTAGEDATPRLWNASNGHWLAAIPEQDGLVTALAFSRDGRWLVTAGKDKKARVWNVFLNYRLVATLVGHTGAIYDASFSSDSQQVLTGSYDGWVKVWRTSDGELISSLGDDNDSGPAVGKSEAFSPDGRRVVHAGADGASGTAEVWDVAKGKLLLTLRHPIYVSHVAFSPDGDRIVTAGGDNMARVWNSHTGQSLATIEGHTAPLTFAEFSPDGQRILTGSRDNSGRVWETSNGRPLFVLTHHPETPDRIVGQDRVVTVLSSRDGARILTEDSHQTNLWDGLTGRLIAVFKGHSPAFSPDDTRVFLTDSIEGDPGSFAEAGWWRALDGQLALRLRGLSGAISQAHISKDGRLIVTSEFETNRVWDGSDGHLVSALPRSSDVDGHGAAFSPDLRYLITFSSDHTARLYRSITLSDLEGLLN
jgi:WD40 repeat protein